MSTSRIRTTIVASLLLTAGLQPALAAEHSTQLTGPQGKTLQRQTTRQQGDASSVTTGPQGQQMQRTVDRSASGATATLSGPKGQTASRNTSVSTSASATK